MKPLFSVSVFLPLILKYFDSRIIKYRNVIETRLYDETRSPEEMIRENEAVKKSCLEHQIRFFEIGDDFNLFVQEVFDWLDRKGKK